MLSASIGFDTVKNFRKVSRRTFLRLFVHLLHPLGSDWLVLGRILGLFARLYFIWVTIPQGLATILCALWHHDAIRFDMV